MEYAQYAALYPDGPDESAFDRLRWEARRIMDRATTGLDGVRKLAVAPPVEEHDAQAVERCEAALVRLLWQTEQAEGCASWTDGTVTGKVVTAVTAGSESVSFAAPAAVSAEDGEAKCRELVERYLSGVVDANGVNLLYMGRYPCLR